jgi:hypothetical protein
MDLRIATDVFFRRRGLRRARIEPELLLGADAYVTLEPAAFVTGLRDWRRRPDAPPRPEDDAADGEWRPL